MIQKFDHIAFEDHVKNTCIEKLHACNDYLSIPSIARKKDQALQKEKRSKKSDKIQGPEKKDTDGLRVTPEPQNADSPSKRLVNDEL